EVYSWQDMTTQQAQNALYSALIATAVEEDGASAFFVDEYLALADLVRTQFWDEKLGLYSDLKQDGTPTEVKTVLALWPLMAKVASLSQVQPMVDHIQNPNEFWRTNLIPALAMDQPGHTPDGEYWNGSVWAPTNYMATTGLLSYGRDQLGNQIAQTYLNV